MKLKQYKQEIVDNLDFDIVSPLLIQNDVITSDEYERLRSLSSNKEKVETLLHLFEVKPITSYKNFVKSLEDDYDWIAFSLRNATVSSNKIKTSPHEITKNVDNIHSAHSIHNLISDESKIDKTSQAFNLKKSGPNEFVNENMRTQCHSTIGVENKTFYNSTRESESDRYFPSGRPRHVYNNERLERGLDETFGVSSSGNPRCGFNNYGMIPPYDDRPYYQGNTRIINNPNVRYYELTKDTNETGHLETGGNDGLSYSSSNYSSPLHSSEYSLKSSLSGDDSISQVGDKRKRCAEEEVITEEIIEFVMENPRIMNRWQHLAHSVGLSNKVEIIKARIRNDGRNYDEHVAEFLREWKEQKPTEATVDGLVNLLRGQKFNDTALKIEEGSFRKKRK